MGHNPPPQWATPPPNGPQKPQKLKVLAKPCKIIDFKHFLENKSSRKLPQNSVFTMKQNSLTSMMRESYREATQCVIITRCCTASINAQPALMHNQQQ